MNSKILMSLLIIGIVATSATAGTWASFSDQETSKDNVFTAGIIDLKIDCSGDTYFDEQDDGPDGTLPKFFNYCSVPDHDIKPGDSGTVVISLHLTGNSNDAWLYMNVINLTDTDPTTSEPEEEAETLGQVNQLSEEILVTVWQDNGGNCGMNSGYAGNGIMDCNEWLIHDGTLASLAAMDEFYAFKHGAVPGCSIRYVGFSWELPYDVGNEHQSDRTQFDITFRAAQALHIPAQCPQNGI